MHKEDTLLMKSRYWEKLWHDILDDHKLGPLSNDLKWRFITLIVAAGRYDRNGMLPDLPDLAWMLRTSEEQLKIELSTLARRELVEIIPYDRSERWLVTNYTKRQTAMSEAERQQRRRAAASSSTSTSYSSSYKKEEEQDKEEEKEVVTSSVTNRDPYVTQRLLQQHGISINRTTRALLQLDTDYVRRHLNAAAQKEEPASYAIKRMLSGEPAP